MSYVFGYAVADGCICKRKGRKNSYTFNITSKDKDILLKIRQIMDSNHPIDRKYNSQRMPYSFIQICNKEVCKDLISLGINPRKTYNLDSLNVPEKYLSDFVRGFFDGDGTVYIYKVNGVLQIKAGFVSTSINFLSNFNQRLCLALGIPPKSIHSFSQEGKLIEYNICFYIDDCEKLADFMYGNSPFLYLLRKHKIFEEWKQINRRHYNKRNYPSKIGWHLNNQAQAASR